MVKLSSVSSIGIAAKLRWFVVAAVIGILALASMLLIAEKNQLIQERQANVQHAVEVAHGILQHYHAQAAKGKLPEAEAKQNAIAAIKALRFNGDDYFWINDMSLRMVMHPMKPEPDGKDLSENKDPNGKRLFVEAVNIVKANDAGFFPLRGPSRVEMSRLRKFLM